MLKWANRLFWEIKKEFKEKGKNDDMIESNKTGWLGWIFNWRWNRSW